MESDPFTHAAGGGCRDAALAQEGVGGLDALLAVAGAGIDDGEELLRLKSM
jgi:hypothetical protein